MNKRPPLIDKDGEVRELSAEDFRLFKPAHEVLAPALQKTLGMRLRGPQKAPRKVPTTIRLSPEVMDYFRSTGNGWQGRVDSVLREYVAKHLSL